MAKPFITIIGLGTTGNSVGLALRREPGEFDIVGHDKSQAAESEAKRMEAVHRTEWNLHRAVEGASIVILALPLPAVEETLPLIAEDIAPEALVLILNGLLQPVVDAAARFLPNHSRVVAAHLITGARAPLTPTPTALQDVACCIAAAPLTDGAALELAGDFADRIGAKPHFMDPIEHDGVAAVVEQLPQVMAAALLAISTGSSGWQEARQVAGGRFAAATDLGSSAAQISRALLANRANVALRLSQLQDELARWQALLEGEPPTPGDSAAVGNGAPAHPLEGELQAVIDARALWETQVISGNWDATASPMKDAQGGGMLRQLFLGNIGRRKPPATK